MAKLGGTAVLNLDEVSYALQTYKNFNILVVSTENITQNWYFGNQRSMLIPNCLFRVGGAAIVLTNRQKYAFQAKYAPATTSCIVPT